MQASCKQERAGRERPPDGAPRGVAQVVHLIQHDEPHILQPLLRLPQLFIPTCIGPRVQFTTGSSCAWSIKKLLLGLHGQASMPSCKIFEEHNLLLQGP